MASALPRIQCPEFSVKSIANLKIGEVLGKGKFGIVYKVTDPRTEKNYALKKFNKANMTTQEIQNVRNEILILCQLQPTCDPYLVCYEGYIEDDDSINLIMENLQGYVSLKKTSAPILMNIIINLVTGLEVIHSHGIAHRDIKPDNIMCKGVSIKFVDFGMACNQPCPTSVTGTLNFLAPEAVKLSSAHENGAEHYQKLDIWALGATIYKLIVGKPPLELGLESYLLGDGLSLNSWKAKLISSNRLLKAFNHSYNFPSEFDDDILDEDEKVIAFDQQLKDYTQRKIGKAISIERMLQKNPVDRSMYINQRELTESTTGFAQILETHQQKA